MKIGWLLALAACAPAHADSLATEKISGTIVAAGPLYPTKAKALAAGPAQHELVVWSLAVVRDHGDVIEARTTVKANSDCVAAWSEPYELTVFVRRDSLLRRTTREVTKLAADKTIVVIDRGAPVTAAGAWVDPMLAATGVTPPAEALAYSLTKYKAAALPPPTGERLACSPPQTKDEWLAGKQREQREREEAAREEQRKKPSPPPKQYKNESERYADLLTAGDAGGSQYDMRDPQPTWCAVSTSPRWGEAPPAKPTFDGTAIGVLRVRHDDAAYRDGKIILADIRATCGRLRLRVEASALTDGVSGGAVAIGGTGGGKRPRIYAVEPGPVTWVDGKAAGKFVGEARYKEHEVEVIKGRYCVYVSSRLMGEQVCHRKADVEVYE